jgi:hypothetical protein
MNARNELGKEEENKERMKEIIDKDAKNEKRGQFPANNAVDS